MAGGFGVETEELLRHAANLEALAERFAAVKAASAHIVQDDEAYGKACLWMPMVMEGRHRRQDELVAYVAENLALAAGELRAAAGAYDDADQASHQEMRALTEAMGG
ncbi:hypothetical protein LO763_05590 [Glycomyces sp. A-F 0318]|uniref:type VII secretion target n=1 Tax=Glycomyces amatae TaxID=2881355 RepID=UPI001E551289|nr:type VII secretion target [Glycomyces amatae]MCD0443100.1 hypothetical protein [Glycomyces amatae]